MGVDEARHDDATGAVENLVVRTRQAAARPQRRDHLAFYADIAIRQDAVARIHADHRRVRQDKAHIRSSCRHRSIRRRAGQFMRAVLDMSTHAPKN
jgi:hypothetical protein